MNIRTWIVILGFIVVSFLSLWQVGTAGQAAVPQQNVITVTVTEYAQQPVYVTVPVYISVTQHATNTVLMISTSTETSVNQILRVETRQATVLSIETIFRGNTLVRGLPSFVEENWPLVALSALAIGCAIGYLAPRRRAADVGPLPFLPGVDSSIPKTMTCDEMKTLLDNWLGKMGPLQDRLDWLSSVSKGYQEDVDSLRFEEEKLEEAIEGVKPKVKEFGDLLSKGGLGGVEYERISEEYAYWLGALQRYRNDSIRLHGRVLDAQEFLDKWKKETDDVHSKLDPLEKKRSNLNKKYVEECIKGKIEGPPIR